MNASLRALAASTYVMMAAVCLCGCNDSNGSTGAGAAPAGSAPSTEAATNLTIAGTPPLTVTAGKAYSFHPTVNYTGSGTLIYSIENLPRWAIFSAASGALSGTPKASDAGTSAKVSIAVTDGEAVATLNGFAIAVGAPVATADSDALEISGTPPKSVVPGSVYTFLPTTSATKKKLTFSITNKPSWAAFDPASGKLSGRPGTGDAGQSTQIAIGVSDGVDSAMLAPFSINVAAPLATVSLSWTPPSRNTDGTAATDLAGYRIYYGSKPSALSQVLTVDGIDKTSFTVVSLASGTWYFAVAAYNEDKVESALSAVVPVTI